MTGVEDGLWSLRFLVYAVVVSQTCASFYFMITAFRHRRAIDRLARMVSAVIIMSGGTVEDLERAIETEDLSAHM